MRNYGWDIKSWLGRFLSRNIREESLLSFIFVLLKPLQDISDELRDSSIVWRRNIRYNSQQGVLQSLLNQIFDPSLARIKVITIADLIPETVIYHDLEVEPVEQILYFDSEIDISPIIYHETETDGQADYKIIVPISLSSQETQILSWVNRYNLADKIFEIEYE